MSDMTNTNKVLIGLIIVAAAVGAYFYFSGLKTQTTNQPQTNNSTTTPTPTPPPPAASTVPDKVVATVETSLGSFELTLDGKKAPKTVENFMKLANENYCNGTKFHRVLKDFVIQGCDPNSRDADPANDGQGGPSYTVPAELGLPANIGAIGMASTAAKGPSSGSQFFIVTTENENNHLSLDDKYTFFGSVTSGMDTVTKIAGVAVQTNVFGEPSQPVKAVTITKITIK